MPQIKYGKQTINILLNAKPTTSGSLDIAETIGLHNSAPIPPSTKPIVEVIINP
jgi:hypothetical protein